jgi:RimJ/RimL family protein N-acetyltransferase
MRMLYGESDAVAHFVGTLIGEEFKPGECQAIGVLNKRGHLVAGWVWHNFSPEAGTLEFSGASVTPKWMTREILHQIFAYAFEHVRCQMIVTRNSADNTTLHKQLTRFGFDRFDIPRLFGRAEDGCVFTLTDEQWRASAFYIGDLHGQEIFSSQAAGPAAGRERPNWH